MRGTSWVPAGGYTDDKQHAHEVMLSLPYAIGKYEVTSYQYCDVMNRAIGRG